MSRLATLDGLKLLLEYARDELEAVGMTDAAQEISAVLVSVRKETAAEERKDLSASSLAVCRRGRLRLVYDQSRPGERHSSRP